MQIRSGDCLVVCAYFIQAIFRYEQNTLVVACIFMFLKSQRGFIVTYASWNFVLTSAIHSTLRSPSLARAKCHRVEPLPSHCRAIGKPRWPLCPWHAHISPWCSSTHFTFFSGDNGFASKVIWKKNNSVKTAHPLSDAAWVEFARAETDRADRPAGRHGAARPQSLCLNINLFNR